MTQPPPFTLVPKTTSHASIEALRTLLKQAENGELIGVAFAAMYQDRTFDVDTAGEAHRSPGFAIQMLMCLIYRLLKKVNG
jgi:hypothetical protein